MGTRVIALFAFDGVQLLDVTGPASVFGVANTLGGDEAYRIVVVSPGGGVIKSSCEVLLQTLAFPRSVARKSILFWSAEEPPPSWASRVRPDDAKMDSKVRAHREAVRFGMLGRFCTGFAWNAS